MRTKQAESDWHPFEEATMTWDWHKTAAECAVQSYGRRDRLRSDGYRYLLQGLHYGLLRDERGLQAKWRS